jgi:hypothetical protein
MEYHCDTFTITVEKLYKMFQEGTLLKLRIQRKKRWVDFDPESKKTNVYNFIKFILKTKNTVNPLLLVEKIVHNDKYMFVIDGNNRINAIISFLNKPLFYLQELIPKDFPKDFQVKLQETGLTSLLNEYSKFKRFCNQNGFKDYHIETIKNDNGNVEDDYEDMIEKLNAFHFLDIKIPVTKFEKIGAEDIKEIYEGVNTGGIKLTKQEILASTTSLCKYDSNSIDKFNDIKQEVIKYYDDMDNSEVLRVEDTQCETLNLFEILISVQSLLCKEYKFIEPVGNLELDVIFKCYDIIYGPNFQDYNPDLNNFIRKFEKACEFINKIQKTVYNSNINHKSIEKTLALKCNNFCLLLIWVYRNIESIEDKNFFRKVMNVVVYHELCKMLQNTDIKKNFNNKDVLTYQAGGSYNVNLGKNILRKDMEQKHLPTKESMLDLLETLAKENIQDCIFTMKAQRKKPTKFIAIILSMYFNHTVPTNLLEGIKNLDHIIPYSITHWEGTLDINRLGNCILIDEAINQSKGNRKINDKFIKEHKLFYYNYPNDTEVNAIMSEDRKRITNTFKYNTMCERREKLYFNTIIDSLYKQ